MEVGRNQELQNKFNLYLTAQQTIIYTIFLWFDLYDSINLVNLEKNTFSPTAPSTPQNSIRLFIQEINYVEYLWCIY